MVTPAHSFSELLAMNFSLIFTHCLSNLHQEYFWTLSILNSLLFQRAGSTGSSDLRGLFVTAIFHLQAPDTFFKVSPHLTDFSIVMA